MSGSVCIHGRTSRQQASCAVTLPLLAHYPMRGHSSSLDIQHCCVSHVWHVWQDSDFDPDRSSSSAAGDGERQSGAAGDEGATGGAGAEVLACPEL